MKGKIFTHREVAARWSYAEVTGRFAADYAANHQQPESVALMAKIKSGAPFDSLDAAERDRLGVWFDTGLRRDYANALNNWYNSFRCESWTKSQLARVHTLPIIDPLGQGRSLAFLSYLAHPRRRLPNGQLETRDPAVAADAVPINTPFAQQEPLVIGHWDDGKLVLWEGNFRAVLFARTADPKAEVLVWMPHEGNWPGKT
ncbi:hypothetical protein [Bradyrhizobium sp. NC92]|uniref:hypothetical protein n=1 Tax=Bradyrhizobium sp. (strain NC92) TaxID=55395 RepID=UPI0021AA8E79|nr:hypothetical protein [Bradyrhizobium sp. NC92]UWU68195.1 hypothetical protein N2602_34710 [Bradyrhizobium sp. NC92]